MASDVGPRPHHRSHTRDSQLDLSKPYMDEETVDRIAGMDEETVDRIADMDEKTVDRLADMDEETVDRIAGVDEKTVGRVAQICTSSIRRLQSLLKVCVRCSIAALSRIRSLCLLLGVEIVRAMRGLKMS